MHLEAFLLSLPVHLIVKFGLLIVFLSALAETIPVLGVFFPGMSIVIIGGVFASFHYLPLKITVIMAILGAIIGDFVGYLIGKYYGDVFLHRYGKYFLFNKKVYESTKRILKNHTGKTLIIGRYNSLTRAFVPFIAGSSQISLSKFMIFNILGGVSWGTIFVILGYFIGSNLHAMQRHLGHYFFYGTIIVTLILYGYYKSQIYFDRLSKSNWGLIGIFSSLFLLFVYLIELIEDHNRYVFRLDNYMPLHIHDFASMTLIHFFKNVTFFASMNFVLAFLLLITILLYFKKQTNKLLPLFLLIFSSELSVYVLKELFARPRPNNPLITGIFTYSFPSGHAFTSLLLAFIIYYFFKEEIIKYISKSVYFWASVFYILLIGASRVFLNVHFFTDIIGGYIFAILWIILFLMVKKLDLKNIHLTLKNNLPKIPFLNK